MTFREIKSYEVIKISELTNIPVYDRYACLYACSVVSDS